MTLFILVLFALILYTYLIYPILIAAVNRFKSRSSSPLPEWDVLPTVTVIIAAHNEENIIKQKLENTLQLDYPRDKLQLVVAADGCTDNTIEIIRTFREKNVDLFEQKEHLGKTSALNKAVRIATGDLIVFSDANGMYQPDVIRLLAHHFVQSSVGCVCGNLVLTNPGKKAVGEGENLYWRYEKWIKEEESTFHSLIGANGSIFAIRRELYTPLDRDIIDDFTTPLLIVRKGYSVVYEPDAKSIEETNEDITQSFSRKVRIILRQLVSLKRYWREIRPLSGLTGFQIVSHKLLRWLVPLWMLCIFVTTLLTLNNLFSLLLFVAQLLFYSSAIVGFLQERKGEARGKYRISFYFCMMNLASLLAIMKFLLGKTQPKWDVAR
jgi:cellulose synthase/poly-beta-1,6-N-acetylglucosamine synthase-like glycosyltransferase